MEAMIEHASLSYAELEIPMYALEDVANIFTEWEVDDHHDNNDPKYHAKSSRAGARIPLRIQPPASHFMEKELPGDARIMARRRNLRYIVH
jgi:hypothetical protein